MFQPIRLPGLFAATLCLSAAFTIAPAAAQESTDPIKLTLHDWTGQLITTEIMGEVLKKAGYSVEYVQADYLAQFAGLETGDLHVAMEMWETTGRDAMDAATATGKVENFGETGMQAKEEWWYPAYMKEKCPGLPNWEALKSEACAEAFSIPETAPKGRYLGGPVTWGGFDDERVEALDLPFEVIHAGTDAALFAELESAYQRQAPILLWIYAPHWAPAKYQGEWVEFPPYSKECYEDPAAGVNPDAAYDCGKPFGPIWKVGWSGVKDKWPGAYAAIKAFSVNNDEMGAMITKVDLDGKKVSEVVAEWMAANEARWSGWIKK
ncbi:MULTISPECIES: ABC transporter substrate-binding protein [unclassified Shinella]|uniref:ABC transporter substrate-binding protein n=1 Tax=unclassified Shinella TaxID=2643062 RepID=UPI00225D36CE|nr:MULTISPECIES: ABC transporter substrate-binding protein [unclassified Shinella]CAI0335297.1 L-proline glycine betaine binding ABC transporter protein ProX (TC 3.A.1.12.1) [Rhizobiaceae bacterium]CAK7259607.1 glycine betaine/proline transport system substrate-binding protein [Shinella sp. WSC3-e]MCO5137835.1 ABC transporter substrate-binding protein [Shinella sp.]MCW5707875.1 ABC transporter substrate-binding protein [Shinella sp.]MDC7257952.1 ABC transporter substrate-binding protein [Shine